MKETYERESLAPDVVFPMKMKKTPEEKAAKKAKKREALLAQLRAELAAPAKPAALAGPRFIPGDIVRCDGQTGSVKTWPADNKGAFYIVLENGFSVTGFANPGASKMEAEFGNHTITLLRRPTGSVASTIVADLSTLDLSLSEAEQSALTKLALDRVVEKEIKEMKETV